LKQDRESDEDEDDDDDNEQGNAERTFVVETKATRRRINMSLVTIGRRIQGCVDRL